MKDDFAKTLSMFSINPPPDQAPRDSEKLFYSLPSSVWHEEAVRCCLLRARAIRANSAKATEVGLHPGKQCMWFSHHHHWSCGAGVCHTGILVSLDQEWGSDQHDPLRNTPKFVSPCSSLILPTGIWLASSSFPFSDYQNWPSPWLGAKTQRPDPALWIFLHLSTHRPNSAFFIPWLPMTWDFQACFHRSNYRYKTIQWHRLLKERFGIEDGRVDHPCNRDLVNMAPLKTKDFRRLKLTSS